MQCAWLIKALCYKLVGRYFDSGWCYWLFNLNNRSDRTMALRSNLPQTNGHQEYLLGVKGGRYVGLKTSLPSCADRIEILEPQTTGTLKGLSRPVMGLL
jgi:hypothetical protein